MTRFALVFLWAWWAGCAGDDPPSSSDSDTEDAPEDSPGVESATCGDGAVDADEACERLDGCAEDERCTDTCTCEPSPVTLPTSQDLIELALEDGTIDYATSLLYRVWALFQAPELPEAYDGEGNAGEDSELFLELSHVRGTLPAPVELAMEPYLVRPTDPASIWSRPVVAGVRRAAAPRDVGCARNAAGGADWRFTASDHVVVWSCGGGVDGTDPFAARRQVTATTADQVWDGMIGADRFGEPRADDLQVGPAPHQRIDIYLLEPNQCRMRDGKCKTISGAALAAATPTAPCDAGEGPLTASGYMLIPIDEVPSGVSPLTTGSDFRASLAHEFFHVLSYGLNLQALGGTCSAAGVPGLAPTERKTWLSEASAEWATFAFFPKDEEARRTGLFRDYQHKRDHTRHGLHQTAGLLPYEASLYPIFIQEQAFLDPKPMIEFWTGSQGARTREDLDDRLNTTLSFATHFRDFAVRNLNRDLPGDPLNGLHLSFADPFVVEEETEAPVQKPTLTLYNPWDLSLPVRIAPLAAQYEYNDVAPTTRYVRIDASDVGNQEHLHVDVIAHLGSTWKRIRVDGPVYEFCRDDDGQDIDQFYLVFSNSDRDRAGQISGDYRLTTDDTCPGGWSGRIRAVVTVEENNVVQGVDFVHTWSLHERQEHVWTVVGTSLVRAPGAPPELAVEHIDTSWRATHSSDYRSVLVTRDCGTSRSSVVEDGGGSGPTSFQVLPLGRGSFSIYATAVPHMFDVVQTTTNEPCDGGYLFESHVNPEPEGIAYVISTPALTWLKPVRNDPGHFVGEAVFIHQVTPLEDGQSVTDITVDWDLRRVRMP